MIVFAGVWLQSHFVLAEYFDILLLNKRVVSERVSGLMTGRSPMNDSFMIMWGLHHFLRHGVSKNMSWFAAKALPQGNVFRHFLERSKWSLAHFEKSVRNKLEVLFGQCD